MNATARFIWATIVKAIARRTVSSHGALFIVSSRLPSVYEDGTRLNAGSFRAA